MASATAEYVPSRRSRSAIDTSAPRASASSTARVIRSSSVPAGVSVTVCTVSAANAAAGSLGSWVNMQPAASRAVAQAPARRERTLAIGSSR